MAIDTKDRIHVVAAAVDADAVRSTPAVKAWGHPSSEIFHLLADANMQHVECHQISPPDPAVANWLPSISRAGLYHPVEKPVILYTHGVKGEGCSPATENDVYCVMVEQID